jgi:tetratricopeptide (TPR) repeat protein
MSGPRLALGAALLALALATPALALATPAAAQVGEDRVRAAKALVLDGRYAEAREAWRAVLAGSRGPEADTAAYYIARCSESLGEHERAFGEYAEFLKRRPSDAVLAEGARTSRVALAVRLHKAGRTHHLPSAVEALQDRSKTVRYFAALQLASLGPAHGRPAVPVLKRIVQEERDEDLVDRAKVALLRVDSSALAGIGDSQPKSAGAARKGLWIRVRIFEKGQAEPKVKVNVPMALGDLVFKSLPDDARRELRQKGYDVETLWQQLQKLGPAEIITVEGDDGERIQIWIE